MLNIDLNTDPQYLTGYLDACSDILDKLGELSETRDLLDYKNNLREYIANGSEELENR